MMPEEVYVKYCGHCEHNTTCHILCPTVLRAIYEI